MRFSLLILLTLFVSACGRSTVSTVRLTAEDHGLQVSVRRGDSLEIGLPGNPTTGFTWEVDTLDRTILNPVGDAAFTPQSDALGAGGTVTLRFEAVQTGETTLVLVYHRPFEPTVPPEETFEVTVQVE